VTDIVVVGAEIVRDQLVELIQRFRLAEEIRLFSRCAECNRPLRPAGEEVVAERVPADVLETQQSFAQCESCGRIYWEGSHTDRIRRFVDQLLAAA
jgi:uncharacterized protein with PIN domain